MSYVIYHLSQLLVFDQIIYSFTVYSLILFISQFIKTEPNMSTEVIQSSGSRKEQSSEFHTSSSSSSYFISSMRLRKVTHTSKVIEGKTKI